jgi:2-oxoisovalerate dehydrogenase E1 component
MAVNRAQIVERNLAAFLTAWDGRSDGDGDPDAPVWPGCRLLGRGLLELLESQFQSRRLDFEARNLKARNAGFHTIGSTGHEGTAAVAAATRPDDPAFLHYRDAAFFCRRAAQVSGSTPLFDAILGMVASSDDPISGGRHKVLGSKRLWIPPQTSTIASHLPKAVGAAIAIDRAAEIGLDPSCPKDAIVVCSFGDASANHNTATGAINFALWASYKGWKVPILFVCEDNGIGISVETPEGWIEHAYGARPGLTYVRGDGLDPVDAYEAAADAADWCREKRVPVFLHLRTVRLLGHAGSDVETEYRTRAEIEAIEALDPLFTTCRRVLEAGLATKDDLLALYEEIGVRCAALGREAERRPKLASAAEIMAPLAPYSPELVRAEAARAPDPAAREKTFGGADALPEKRRPRHLAAQLNQALHDALLKYPEALLFGEDVAKKGGVYHVTEDLRDRFGDARCFDTLLDETSILGLALGAAHMGFLPLPEIQYLAYFHNAEDQIRGEACSLQYFSNGQFRNPAVVRVAGWGYQKGFGGHFHNDNSIAALRDIPGVVVCTPSRADDAVGMLRTCLALAKVDGRVVLFVEPIALYMTKDLYVEKDEKWSFRYPPIGEATPFLEARVYDADVPADVLIVSFGNGAYLSLRAAKTLLLKHDVRARVVDLRWLQPWDEETVLRHARDVGRVLVVDEGRRTGGLSEAILATLTSRLGADPPVIARYAGEDVYIPLGTAWTHVLPSEDGVVARALHLAAAPRPQSASR